MVFLGYPARNCRVRIQNLFFAPNMMVYNNYTNFCLEAMKTWTGIVDVDKKRKVRTL